MELPLNHPLVQSFINRVMFDMDCTKEQSIALITAIESLAPLRVDESNLYVQSFIGRVIADIGCTYQQAIELIEGTPWNKSDRYFIELGRGTYYRRVNIANQFPLKPECRLSRMVDRDEARLQLRLDGLACDFDICQGLVTYDEWRRRFLYDQELAQCGEHAEHLRHWDALHGYYENVCNALYL